MSDSSQSTVLVSGASGFIAMHCVLQLLEQGYQVRGTLRSLDREQHIRNILSQHIEIDEARLEFVCADLLEDVGWQEATSGCEYVLHVASPFPIGVPAHEDDLIIPAKEGTLRVLKAAAKSGVKRVVLTSSVVAIMEGHGKTDKVFDENDWSNLDGDIGPYPKSKTIAERAAWDFIAQQESATPLELSVINPGFVMGPLLDGKHFGTSAETIRKIMGGEYPGVPRIMFSIVDVRDVAAAHLAAMTTPNAAGKRYLCTVESVWFKEICDTLNQHFSGQGYKIPTRQLPDIAVRIFSLVDSSARNVVKGLGQEIKFSNQQIIQDLNWKPYSAREAIIAMAESLVHQGVV